MNFKVGDRVKLKTLEEISNIFRISESQERIIQNYQNKTFRIEHINDDVVTLNKDLFKNGYNGVININALKLCNKIKLSSKYFEL